VIRVLLADDQALVRQALAALLALEPDIEIVGQAADAAAAVALAAERQPDVVLMDVQMSSTAGSGEDGITATARIRLAAPATRVIIVTTFGRPGYLRRAMEAGAVGFMVKDAPAEKFDRGHPTGAPRAAGGRSDAGRRELEHRILTADRT
jgi:two-component system, NarL family, response regulator DesR